MLPRDSADVGDGLHGAQDITGMRQGDQFGLGRDGSANRMRAEGRANRRLAPARASPAMID